MDLKLLNEYYNRFKYGEDNFHSLMQFRVREILLISTLYDAYTFEQESRLSQQLVGEYHELKLTTIPRITNVPTAADAMEKLKEQKFDLIITTMRVAGLSAFELSRRIRSQYRDVPILLLLTNKADLSIVATRETSYKIFDNIFLWNGDSKLILAMIKYIEDKKNVEYDTKNGLVRVILLVEDSIPFYSLYLPALYTEIMIQTQRLITEELNDAQKYYRMRARPKVLSVRSYEEAMEICRQYNEYLLCVISDVRFEREGTEHMTAGLELIENINSEGWEFPVLIQSSELNDRRTAQEMKASFIYKQSPNLLFELKTFIMNNLGFGDFVFRNPQGLEIDRAHSLADLEEKLKTIPLESLRYHSMHNHFSAWLIAHGEIQVARRIRPVKDSDFPDTEAHREFLISVFNQTRLQRRRGKVLDFEKSSLDMENQIIKMTEGSLGGKGRGIAFFNSLFSIINLDRYNGSARIKIPKTYIIGTDEFDAFIGNNNLRCLMGDNDDQFINAEFLRGDLSESLKEKLIELLKVVNKPLAVRSSGLLEDSQSQPFAGIYDTYMLPNSHPSPSYRLEHLERAIKLVFASVYRQNAKSYLESLNYRLEDEKMAVLIQEIVGQEYNGYYYPHLSGIAQSYNYYPVAKLKHKDGVAVIAAGLGHSVVDGGRAFRFSPRYPEINFFSLEDQVRYSQTEMYVLKMPVDHDPEPGLEDRHSTLDLIPLSQAEKHGTLTHLASVWDAANNRIDEGLLKEGPRVVNFPNILKYKIFPLSNILLDILEISEVAFGVPVEIEFAVDLSGIGRRNGDPSFYFLQIRPLTVSTEEIAFEENLSLVNRDRLLLYAEETMGQGIINNLYDIVVVDDQLFNRLKTASIREEVAYFNNKLNSEGNNYILIGPGRWGSRDPSLGIPVNWAEISGAKIIVEAGVKDFVIEPSQGTHFFHNLVAMNVGYINVAYGSQRDYIDWQWIRAQSPCEKLKYTYHLRSQQPFAVKMDGKKGVSLIYKNV